ncbi:MAG: glutamate 5-kinase [Spirochaetales bacterium]|nr:glutamate 5-kinase [Spirochaetales bacterium]
MRDLTRIKRVVIKVGTNLLSSSDGINRERVAQIVSEVASLHNLGYQVILVSSGAIGLGAKALSHTSPVVHIAMRQACAAIGQPILMSAYQEEFSKHNLISSQVLITRSVLNNRTSFKNLRSSVSTLLALGVIPIFNENDAVSTSEIGNVFGDNDRMSALVASKIDAELLILLTDIDGLYTGNPKKDKDAVIIKEVGEITNEIFSYAKGAGSAFATGGMKTKLLAAQIAQKGGCGTIIASGYEEHAITRILRGEEIGTYILPEHRLAQRERWIINTPAQGRIIVDDGAKHALVNLHKSLLPSGIRHVEGIFAAGDVVEIATADGVFMKAVPYFNSTDLAIIQGHNSTDIENLLGKGRKEIIFRPEDTAIIE